MTAHHVRGEGHRPEVCAVQWVFTREESCDYHSDQDADHFPAPGGPTYLFSVEIGNLNVRTFQSRVGAQDGLPPVIRSTGRLEETPWTIPEAKLRMQGRLLSRMSFYL